MVCTGTRGFSVGGKYFINLTIILINEKIIFHCFIALNLKEFNSLAKLFNLEYLPNINEIPSKEIVSNFLYNYDFYG